MSRLFPRWNKKRSPCPDCQVCVSNLGFWIDGVQNGTLLFAKIEEVHRVPPSAQPTSTITFGLAARKRGCTMLFHKRCMGDKEYQKRTGSSAMLRVWSLVLPRSAFAHTPKTGGTWLRNAIKEACIPSWEEGETHSRIWEVSLPGPRFLFASVRHPLRWYQSMWAFGMRTGVECDRRTVSQMLV